MKQRFRPYRSVSFPPGIIRAAITSRNNVIATCTPCTVVSRSVLMSLIITFMLEPAKLQMNCANANGTRTRSQSSGRIRPYRCLHACHLSGVVGFLSTDAARVQTDHG